ncbi:hypothetical protein [Streptomyces pilosus]|uniref:hypothetical protein n=1 Tax=Streptomyces pilosus TaxID=28893 RepID=UPI00362BE6B7
MPQSKPAHTRAETPAFVVTTMAVLVSLVVVTALFGTETYSQRAFRLLNKD